MLVEVMKKTVDKNYIWQKDQEFFDMAGHPFRPHQYMGILVDTTKPTSEPQPIDGTYKSLVRSSSTSSQEETTQKPLNLRWEDVKRDTYDL